MLRLFLQSIHIVVMFSMCVAPIGTHAEGTAESDAYAQLEAVSAYLELMVPEQQKPRLTETELRTIIKEGKEWLIAAQEPNGHFRYEYAPYEDRVVQGDNIVRQTGALYQLGELARFGDTDPELRKAIRSAIDYFETLTAEDEYGGKTIRCVAYTNELESCPLGATSLALAGVLGYLTLYPEDEREYRELVDGYVAYILASQKENGGFRNVHRIGSNFQSEKESSFSNGEALMVLSRYYAQKRSADVKQAIDHAFLYLKDTPFDGPLYLWIMAALKDLHVLDPQSAYTDYADQYTKWRVESVQYNKHTKKNYCAYAEGIASAYSILESTQNVDGRAALKAEIDLWNRKNASLQLTESDRYRVIEREGGMLELAKLGNPEVALGGFLTGHSEPSLRIDFTQHCLSAYIQTLVDIEKREL